MSPGQDDPNAAATARVGQALNAKWTLDALLGVGGMGAVYAATHRNGSRAAVKVLHLEFARDNEIRERFLREGKIANTVDHPARVPVTDDDVSDDGAPFLVMDLLTGETLNQRRLRCGGKLPLADALKVFDPVLELLGECHAVGIVHRDIKPANIFITTDESVKVLDFGVARMREANSKLEATQAGTAIGTPAYVSPEQALGLVTQVDGRSDLFSVGACLYLTLSGQRLNQARSEAESIVMAATQAAPSIANVAPDLPVEVVAFIDRALAFERDRRFPDAKAMRSELLGLLAAARAGQLVATAPKAKGLKTRGNEALEEEELSDEEKREVEKRLAAVWKQLGICLADVRQYGWTHPQAVRAMELGYQQITEALAAHPASVRWDVGPGAFVFEGTAVWAPDRIPFDRIPYQLFADGVRRIQIKQGFTKEELRDLVAIFLNDVLGADSSENDAVTALWDRRLEHVAYVAIESFGSGEGVSASATDLAHELVSMAQLDRDLDDGSLEGRAMTQRISTQLRESGEAAAALAIDPLARATLGAQLNLSEDVWRDRFVDAFADGYMEARPYPDLRLLQDVLHEWADDQLKLHAYAELFGLSAAVTSALSRREPALAELLEREIGAVVLPPATLATILQSLEKERKGAEARDIDPVLASGLRSALERLDDASLLELACGCLGVLRAGELSDALRAYVKRTAIGNEMRLATVLESANAETGVMLVTLLAEIGTPDAHLAIEWALKSKELTVRVEALSHMGETKEEQVRAEVRRMLDDVTSSVRTQALRLVAERGLKAAGPAIVIKIQAEDFHDMAIDERRLWMESLVRLNPRRAATVCAELLKQHKLIPSEALEGTRVIAAEMLAETGDSKEALEATAEAMKKRWWNSAAVREAAAQAAERIRARAGGAT